MRAMLAGAGKGMTRITYLNGYLKTLPQPFVHRGKATVGDELAQLQGCCVMLHAVTGINMDGHVMVHVATGVDMEGDRADMGG